MSALSTLNELAESGLSQRDNPPRIIIENKLPSGYDIVSYGCAFYYRRNQEKDPTVVTKDDVRISPGESVTVRERRRDCCRLVIVGVDIRLPNGNEIPVFANAEAPDGTCIIQEKFAIAPTSNATSISVIASLVGDSELIESGQGII